MNLNKKACNCNGVTYGMIMDAVAAGDRTFEEVQKRTHCSKGCGRCEEFIRCFVRNLVEEAEQNKQA